MVAVKKAARLRLSQEGPTTTKNHRLPHMLHGLLRPEPKRR
jgi:hypothetical protein